MAKVEGLEKLVGQLRRKAAKVSQNKEPSVSVGYSARYALYVHENLQMNHRNGMAKFLELPAKILKPTLAAIVKDNLGKGRTFSEALLAAGIHLQHESQKVVPVLTGTLKNSAFTRLDQ